MKALALVVIALVVVWMQTALFGQFRPLGVMPDIVLVTVILIALWLEATPTLAMATACGLLLDMASGDSFGLRTGFLVVVSLVVIAARQFGLHSESLLTAGTLVVATTVAFNLIVIASLSGATIDWTVVGSRIGLQIVDNLAVLLIILAVRTLAIDRRHRVASELRRGSWQ
jgi:cell shape-determining protein MreD